MYFLSRVLCALSLVRDFMTFVVSHLGRGNFDLYTGVGGLLVLGRPEARLDAVGVEVSVVEQQVGPVNKA